MMTLIGHCIGETWIGCTLNSTCSLIGQFGPEQLWDWMLDSPLEWNCVLIWNMTVTGQLGLTYLLLDSMD